MPGHLTLSAQSSNRGTARVTHIAPSYVFRFRRFESVTDSVPPEEDRCARCRKLFLGEEIKAEK